jgi:hypothetical protein
MNKYNCNAKYFVLYTADNGQVVFIGLQFVY